MNDHLTFVFKSDTIPFKKIHLFLVYW